MFKNLYKDGEYDIKNSPYKVRGAFISRRDKLAEEQAKKVKEPTAEEKLEVAEARLKELSQEIADKKLEVKILEDQYNELVGKAERDIIEKMHVAEQEAAALKEQKAKEGHTEGFDKGYYEGLEKGRNETMTKLSGLINTMTSLTESTLREKHEMVKHTENDIVNLSIDIAKKVVHREISSNREIIVEFVKEAIKKLEDKEKIIIYANPEDIEIIKHHREQFRELIDSMEGLHILPDELLERGEVKLESKSEIVDTDINYQFGEIKKKLNPGA